MVMDKSSKRYVSLAFLIPSCLRKGMLKTMDGMKIDNRHFAEAKQLDSVNDAKHDYSLFDELKKLSDAETIEEQIQIIKLMSSNCHDSFIRSKSRSVTYFLDLIVDVYFQSIQMEPLKKVIVVIFQKLPRELFSEIVTIMCSAVKPLFVNCDDINQGQDSFDVIDHKLDVINACLNNGPIGLEAIDTLQNYIVKHLVECLSFTVRAQDTSFDKQVKCASLIHTVTQVMIVMLQRCPSVLSQLVSESGEQVCEDILMAVTVQMAREDGGKVETMNNCGYLLVMVVEFVDKEEGLIQMARGLLPPILSKLGVTFYTFESQASICVALLNVLKLDQQCRMISQVRIPMLQMILIQLISLANMNCVNRLLMLNITRGVELLSSHLSRIVSTPGMPMENVQYMVGIMRPFMWDSMEHGIASIQHLACNILSNLVLIGQVMPETGAVQAIVNDVADMPVDKKSRYIGLRDLGKRIGCKKLVDKMPDLVSSMIETVGNVALQNSVVATMETLVVASFSEMEVSAWKDTWIDPIVQAFSAEPHVPMLEKILATADSLYPSCFNDVAEHPETAPITVQLAIAKLAKQKVDHRVVTATDKWSYLIPYRVMVKCMYHENAAIRHRALLLIVQCRRTSDVFTNHERPLLLGALQGNITSDDPAATQGFVAIVKQMVVRLAHGFNAELRNIEREQDEVDMAGPAESRIEAIFMKVILDWCMACFFPGASGCRRSTALRIIGTIVECLGWGSVQPVLCTKRNGMILMELLTDPYESNRGMTHKLLINFPPAVLGFEQPKYLQTLITTAITLASSNRPPDSLTAAYFLKTLCKFAAPTAIFSEVPGYVSHETLPVYQCVLQILIARLQQELEVAQCNLLNAATNGPMYGVLSAIRYILGNIDLRLVSKNLYWQLTFKHLIETALKLLPVVAPVVNNSSPEGHLPMDFDDARVASGDACKAGDDASEARDDPREADDTAPEASDEASDDAGAAEPTVKAKVTSQMVLLCGWRTVREVALLFAFIAQQSPMDPSDDDSRQLVIPEQLSYMGTNLMKVLSETKHRGAFEQAYLGLVQVVTRLWRCDYSIYHVAPLSWLNAALATVRVGENLCVTRRGAGLPFIIQALIITEPPGKHGTLNLAMEALLPLALGGTTEDIRVLSLNVLRALFRHNQLGSAVGPYVARGVKAALLGFKSGSWAERNAATLLFSSLVTRIFGVPRSRNKLGSKDRMKPHIFFGRYPTLLKTLIDELSAPDDGVTRDCKYPILLLLARLSSSPSDNARSRVQVGIFIYLAHKCGYSPVLKMRQLAAKAHASLVTYDTCVIVIQALLDRVQSSSLENTKHGCLLQVLCLLEEMTSEKVGRTAIEESVQHWAEECNTLIEQHPNNYVVLQTLTDILLHILKCFNEKVQISVWQRSMDLLMGKLEECEPGMSSSCSDQVDVLPGTNLFKCNAAGAILSFVFATMSDPETVISTFIKLLSSPNPDVLLVSLEVLVKTYKKAITSKTSVDIEALVKAFNKKTITSEASVDIVQDNCVAQLDKVIHSLSLAEDLASLVLALVENPDMNSACRATLFELLHYMPRALVKLRKADNERFAYLLELCKSEDDNGGAAIVQCISTLVGLVGFNDDNLWLEFASVLVKMSSTKKSANCREAVAKLLLDNPTILDNDNLDQPEVVQCMLHSVAIRLHLDPDPGVRRAVTSTPGLPVTPQNAMALYVERFVQCRQRSNEVKAMVLLGLALHGGEADGDGDSDADVSQDCLFERDESNPFAEEVLLTDWACEKLVSPMFRGMHWWKFDSVLMEWLVSGCLPHVKISAPLPTDYEQFKNCLSLCLPRGIDINDQCWIRYLVPSAKSKQLDNPTRIGRYKINKLLSIDAWLQPW